MNHAGSRPFRGRTKRSSYSVCRTVTACWWFLTPIGHRERESLVLDWQLRMNQSRLRKVNSKLDRLVPLKTNCCRYDFSKAVRGVTAARYATAINVIPGPRRCENLSQRCLSTRRCVRSLAYRVRHRRNDAASVRHNHRLEWTRKTRTRPQSCVIPNPVPPRHSDRQSCRRRSTR